jgi:twitching motility protein PilT
MTIRDVLIAMIDKDASDLHLVEGNPPSFIINGRLSFHGNKALTRSDLRLFLDDIMDDDGRQKKLLAEKELDFAYELEGKARFRVNAYFQRNSVAFAIRMIPLKVPSLAQLHLPGELRSLTQGRGGLVLVVGPAKCGKSTTMAALVNIINEETSAHIVTIEDPIEYVYRPRKCIISQREINEDALSFSEALRHILRQSPGVVAVDGVADKESIKMVLEAAETGHLVICTLLAWNAIQSINKLADYFPEEEKRRVRAQISRSIKAVVSQRLLRRKDGKGLICACEVLQVNDAMRGLIREDRWNQVLSLVEDLRREGLTTLNDQFASLVRKDLVDLKEIVDQGPDKQGFADEILLQ